jgi:hypothetical protein
MEMGITEHIFFLPFSDRRRGQGKRLQQLKEICFFPLNSRAYRASSWELNSNGGKLCFPGENHFLLFFLQALDLLVYY